VAQFAATSLSRDPASAMAWARSIADPDLRSAQLEYLGNRWMQMNSAPASAWITDAEELTPASAVASWKCGRPPSHPASGFHAE
jgi:hypothetical protein